LSSWISGDENGQASGALANDLPANNADNRFHGASYRASPGAGQEACRMQAKVVVLKDRGHGFVMIWLIRDRHAEGRFAMLHRILFPEKKRNAFFGHKSESEAFPSPREASRRAKMKAAKTTDYKPLVADLVTKYRPLGLKAVLAAALQAKAKPADSKRAERRD
jgi:hypothetical protein